jgi:peptidoglycan DL-endopeptidase LytE
MLQRNLFLMGKTLQKEQIAMVKRYGNRLQCAIITCLILVFSLSGPIGVHAQYRTIPTSGIAINGKMVNGINPIKIGNTYYLPLVHLSKILGYNNILFNQDTLTYQITDGSTTIRTTMGGTRAKKSNEYINIDAPRWINKTAYVSIHAGSSLFNVYIYFEPKNGTFQIQKPAQLYLVQSGDSLWTIARAHHTTVSAIKAANNLKSNLIYNDQALKIPPREKTKELEPIREKQHVKSSKGSTLQEKRKNIINEARKYLGAGYKFGASLAEAPRLFDCSSYTQLVFKNNDITIPRVSRDQASIGNYAKDLREGDLLFFTDSSLYSDGRVGHVGIYMADGSMIHASSSKGVTITKNVLANPYWGKNYLFSKRVVQ